MRKAFCIALVAASMGLSVPVFASEKVQGGAGADAVKESRVQEPAKDERKIIVARVNGVDISMHSLTKMMEYRGNRKEPSSESSQEKEALRKDALDRLIFEELAYQRAVAQGLKSNPADVDKTIEAIKIKTGGEDGFREQLKKDDSTEEELRSQIARNAVLSQIFKKEILDKVHVSEDDIKEAYEKEKEKFLIAEKVVVEDVVFFLDPDNAGSARQVEEVLAKLPETKKDVKSLVPDGSFVVRELEVTSKKHPQLYEEAKKLKVGELSGVIKTGDSLHVLQLKEYSPEKKFSIDEMRAFLMAEVGGRARMKRLAEWKEELRKGAKIEILDTGEAKKK